MALQMAQAPKRSPLRCPTHPGALLREIVVPALPITKTELATALGISRQSLVKILAERQPVTPAMAIRLGWVFEQAPASWLNMQTAYDLWHAERSVDTSKMKPLKLAS
jgi:addiction module HigA family antidote